MYLKKFKERNYQKEYRKRNKVHSMLWQKKYYQKNRKFLQKVAKEYYHSHKKAKQLYSKNFRKLHPRILKNRSIKRLYNLTSKEFLLLKKKQKYLCLICQKKKKLFIDHCHKIQKVRGLLCHSCNIALGHFKDNIDNLKRAIQYLGKWKELLQGL